MKETLAIPAGPGRLTATLYPAPAPRAAAVLNPATGVAQVYYRAFARWLAEARGVTCLTYDYRGFGASAEGPARMVPLQMADWGITDQQAARDWLAARCPDLPLWVIGHSLGGFMLGYQTGLADIARVIAVASGPVHVRDHPWPYQAMARLFWFGLGPALVATTGYLPARLSGLGADLPGPVFRQWKRWCTRQGFHRADTTLPPWGATRLTAPLRTVALADDVMIPPHVVERLGRLYTAAPQTHVTLAAAAFRLGSVGHLAAFARRNAALWPAILGD
ncbi:alpha/beta hydrolase family protein [Marimonas arenosa]|uniref:Alpha/beta fold hydrolase n=1 Tax=Marimonas arenosa TaxID=1795305 RepID=A0AAE3WED7_9RHOB|nr:alpha/beta fold hydrolase [Marimonas arenosa]MDQ2091197.1 alpha/beta fold hydrolase [Marimonas arenosa]